MNKKPHDSDCNKLLRANILITPENTEGGYYIQINRKGKIIKGVNIYKSQKSIQAAIQKAIKYEIKKLEK